MSADPDVFGGAPSNVRDTNTNTNANVFDMLFCLASGSAPPPGASHGAASAADEPFSGAAEEGGPLISPRERRRAARAAQALFPPAPAPSPGTEGTAAAGPALRRRVVSDSDSLDVRIRNLRASQKEVAALEERLAREREKAAALADSCNWGLVEADKEADGGRNFVFEGGETGYPRLEPVVTDVLEKQGLATNVVNKTLALACGILTKGCGEKVFAHGCRIIIVDDRERLLCKSRGAGSERNSIDGELGRVAGSGTRCAGVCFAAGHHPDCPARPRCTGH